MCVQDCYTIILAQFCTMCVYHVERYFQFFYFVIILLLLMYLFLINFYTECMKRLLWLHSHGSTSCIYRLWYMVMHLCEVNRVLRSPFAKLYLQRHNFIEIKIWNNCFLSKITGEISFYDYTCVARARLLVHLSSWN